MSNLHPNEMHPLDYMALHQEEHIKKFNILKEKSKKVDGTLAFGAEDADFRARLKALEDQG